MCKSLSEAVVAVAAMVFLNLSHVAYSDDLWLASQNEFPGRLRLSEGGTVPRVVLSRADHANPAFPNAIMKVARIAPGPERELFYCSGLDGSVMHLLDGRHEAQAFEFPGQVRDLACTSEPHTIYFSVVDTPQGSAPLGDGAIYRRDLWEGQATLVAEIRQAEVGHQWWGTFALRDDTVYLATHDSPSRIIAIQGGRSERVFTQNAFNIHGLGVGPDGQWLFVDGSGTVYQTQDFVQSQPVLQTGLRLSDVAHRPLQSTVRP